MRRDYAAVLAAAACCCAALGAVLRILPDVIDAKAVLGLAVGAPALTALVTRPGGGRLADRVGPRRVVVAGALVMAAGVVPALITTAPGPLVASRLLVGAGEGAMMAAAVLWLLRLAGDERRGRALGHIGLANYAGLAAGPLLADVLGTPTRVLVAAAVLPPAGAAFVARRHPPERPATEQAGARGLVRAIAFPGIGLALVNVGYVALIGFGTAAASGDGVAAAKLVVPVFAVGVILGRTAGAPIPDRAGARPTLAVCSALAAAGLAALAFADASLPALVAVAVLAAGQSLAVPSLGLLALERVPAASHGAAAGLFFAFFDLGVGGGGPLVGLAAKATSPSGALLFAAGSVALAAPIGSATFASGRSSRTRSRGCRRRSPAGTSAGHRTR